MMSGAGKHCVFSPFKNEEMQETDRAQLLKTGTGLNSLLSYEK